MTLWWVSIEIGICKWTMKFQEQAIQMIVHKDVPSLPKILPIHTCRKKKKTGMTKSSNQLHVDTWVGLVSVCYQTNLSFFVWQLWMRLRTNDSTRNFSSTQSYFLDGWVWKFNGKILFMLLINFINSNFHIPKLIWNSWSVWETICQEQLFTMKQNITPNFIRCFTSRVGWEEVIFHISNFS